MAQNYTSDQNQSVAELEAELAASRERLGRNIDELVYRAQPKTIIAEQKAHLRLALKSKYSSLMGTSQTESYTPAGTTEQGPSPVDALKAKALGLKEQAAAKAAELKEQRSSTSGTTVTFADTDASQAAEGPSKVDELKAKAAGLKEQAQAKLPTRSEYKGGHSDGSDLTTQVRAKADEARLKLDELTHTPEGELRTDRVAAALATTGAVLVGLGAARRAGN